MSNIMDAVLDGEPTPMPAPEPAPEPSSEAPAQPRDEQGRFAPVPADYAPPEAPQAPDSAPAAPEPGQPPLTAKETVAFYKAMQDERDKRQALEKQLADLRARVPASEEGPADPETRLQQTLYAQRLDMSRAVAEAKYGAETVAKVHDWARERCDADPYFNQQMLNARLPYEDAYQAWRAAQVLDAVKPDDPSELEAFRAWKAQQGQPDAPPAATAASAPPPPSPPPPRTLATAPGSGAAGRAAVSAYPGAAFDEVLGQKG